MKRDEQIKKFSKKLEKNLKTKVEGETVVITGGDDLYKNNLPDGVTLDQVKQVEHYNHDFIDAAATAVAHTAADAFKSIRRQKKATASMKFGNSGSITTTVIKEKTYRNPSTGKEFTAPAVNSAVKWNGATGSKAYQRRMRNELAEMIAGK